MLYILLSTRMNNVIFKNLNLFRVPLFFEIHAPCFFSKLVCQEGENSWHNGGGENDASKQLIIQLFYLKNWVLFFQNITMMSNQQIELNTPQLSAFFIDVQNNINRLI